MCFKCFVKVGSVIAEVTHAGRLFHRRGAATPKARSPAVYSRDLRLTSLLNEAERSRQIVSQILRCCLVTALKHKNGQSKFKPFWDAQPMQFFQQWSDTVVLAVRVSLGV